MRKPAPLVSGNTSSVALAIACTRQSHPSQRIAGIKLSRPFVIHRRLVRIFTAVPRKEVTPLQIGVEGPGIDLARVRQFCFLLRTQTQLDFTRHSLGYVVLHTKNILRAIVVILGPQMSL